VMSAFVKEDLRIAQSSGWLDQLERLIARELAPSPRKFRTAARIATIATIGAGLIAICHVYNEFGTYFVWLLAGAGPMMSARRATLFLIAEALALVAAVVMARTLAETPWLMLPFLFAALSLSTYFGKIWKVGTSLLLIEVVCLNTFYGVIYAPEDIGWNAAGAFGGCFIAFGVLVLFDNWLWPDPGEKILMESLGNSVGRARARLIEATSYYLDHQSASRPPLPPPTSALPSHMALLDQAMAEGISEHRHAILLAAITRVARINLEVDRLIVTARQEAPRRIRAMVWPEIQATVEALAVVLEGLSREMPTHIAVGSDKRPPEVRIRARAAMDALSARILQVRPGYIGTVSSGEIENLASLVDSIGVLTRLIERLLDEPPQPPAGVSSNIAVPQPIKPADPALVRYSVGWPMRGGRLHSRRDYPSRGSVYYPDYRINNRASDLRRGTLQDNSAHCRSDDRWSNRASRYHCCFPQLRHASGLSTRVPHSLFHLRVLCAGYRAYLLRGQADRGRVRAGVRRLGPGD
jgi:hypothetical protein